MRARLFACRIPVRNLRDSRRWHYPGVRVAIVAESFLPNVNGVTNSVLRVIEHLRRTGHEALVIAPDTPRGEPPADRLHDGVRVHRVPSRMFPKVTSLPLGVPRPRMVGVLRGFDPDVVHLASPALLGYGGLHAARYLGVPTVAVFQTDVAGFAESYGVGVMSRAAWAWTRHLHTRPTAPSRRRRRRWKTLSHIGIPRVHHWGRGVDVTGFVPSARDDALRAEWSPDGKPIVGFVGRLAPEKHVERLGRAGRPRRPSGGGRRRRRRPRQARIPHALSRFHRRTVWRRAGHRVREHGRVRPPRRARDVLPGRAGGDGVGPAGRSRPMRAGRAIWSRRCTPDCCLPVGEFEARLSESVDHLIAERQRYSVAARRSVLGRTWPAVCDQLLGHYEAVRARGASPQAPPDARPRAASALGLRDRLPLLPGLDPALVVGLGQLNRQLPKKTRSGGFSASTTLRIAARRRRADHPAWTCAGCGSRSASSCASA